MLDIILIIIFSVSTTIFGLAYFALREHRKKEREEYNLKKEKRDF